MEGTSSALLVDSMLIKRTADYLVLMPLRAPGPSDSEQTMDVDAVNAAFIASGLSNIVVIDLLAESTNLFEGYRHETLKLAGLGCLFIVGLLFAATRSLRRTLRLAIPLACAVLCVMAGLVLCNIQLSILHVVGLLLVVAVGSNYALFFDSATPADSGASADRRQTQVSLLVANLTSVGSFGLLGFSKVPVLTAIGSTVGPGAFLALVFAAILTRTRPDANTD
jgi:predicted exporter